MRYSYTRWAIGLVLVASLAAAGCSNGPSRFTNDPTTIDEFLATYARAYCEKTRPCSARDGAYTAAECESLVIANQLSDPRLAPGSFVLDRDAAKACLALLAASPVCTPFPGWQCFGPQGVFVGTAAAGSACDSDAWWLCAPGTECSAGPSGHACGTCVAVTLVDPGEPCTSLAECRQTATTLARCGFNPVDNRVECNAVTADHEVAIGESCAGLETFCGPGAQCDSSERCVVAIAIGAECDPKGGFETAPLGCIGGAPCVEDASSTLGGICRAFVVARSVGDPCGLVGTDFVECSRAAGLDCDPSTNLCAQHVAPGLGEPCGPPCATGLTCGFWSNNICIARLADGQPCEWNDQCLSAYCLGPDGGSVCGSPTSVATACAR